MTTRLEAALGRTPGQRRTRLAIALATVVAVPLAVAGLVTAAISGGDDQLEAIPAVVVNNDEFVTTTDADGEEQVLLAGRLLVTELTGPDMVGFDWTISNDEEAAEALADGDAYAVLTIPEDFSASVATISGDAPEQAELTIVTDDAHAYLTGSVAQSVGDAMSSAFGREITEQYLAGLYGGLETTADALGDAADGATQLADGVDELAGGLDGLAGGADATADGVSATADGAAATASGAGEIAGGVGGLAKGLDQLAGGVGSAATGAAEAASGAHAYADGVALYASGVDGVADGAAAFSAGISDPAHGLDALTAGVTSYVGGVSDAADGFGMLAPQLEAVLAAADAAGVPGAAQLMGAPTATAQGLDALVVAGETGTPAQPGLIPSTAAAVGATQAGAADLADGAAQVSAGSAEITGGADDLAAGVDGLAAGLGQLSSASTDAAGGANQLAGGAFALADGAGQLAGGASQLADGARQLADGTSGAASGASELSTGAGALADGLTEGADEAAAVAGIDAEQAAAVVAAPVVTTAERANPIASVGEAVGMFFVPVGLWVGALAMFLIFRPVTAAELRSTAPTGRIVFRGLARAGLVGLAQAVVATVLLHVSLGVGWAMLPQTLAYAGLIALVFTALHAFLSTWLGRLGMVVSLVLLAVQLLASGGLFPVEILSAPFQAISPFLPLTWAVAGMQAIVSGVGGSAVAMPALILAAFGLFAVLGSLALVARRRGARSFGFASARLADR